MARGGQVASSFVAVVALYWVYWLIAVPLIEPGVEYQAVEPPSELEIEQARQEVNSRQLEIAKYFPPDSWELDHPAVWQSDQTRLLFKTLTPLKDGTVELRPCTLLFFPKDGAGGAASNRPIILRAVEGANVRFDEAIELKSVDIGKRQLTGGRLIGPIRIYRNPSARASTTIWRSPPATSTC